MWSNVAFQGCEFSVAHIRFSQMPSNVKANLLHDGIVDTLVSVGASARGQRAHPFAQLLDENLVNKHV
jgi:hypothetical protein